MFQETAPSINPWLSPTFLLSLAGAIVMAIAWLLRLEFKVNATDKRQGDHELAMADDLGRVEDEIKNDRGDTREWKKIFYQHATDTKMHHNEEMFKEFRAGIDRRFSGLEGTLLDMNRKLDHLADRD